MMGWNKHIARWLSSLLMLLLLVACSSDSSEDSPQPEPNQQKPVLKLYLFAPESPIVTRASGDPVLSNPDDEKRIKTLQVWVFVAGTNTLVSYVKLEDLGIIEQREVLLDITEDFALQSPKPEVDVFVAANVTTANCGLAFDQGTNADVLKSAKIGSAYFGVSSPVNAVPTDGLPMTGRLINQTITGTSPVFQIANTPNVKLVRGVSKVRFVFCKSSSNPPTISDLSISLGTATKKVLPTQEYLFLENQYKLNQYFYRVDNSAYENAADLITGIQGDQILSCDNPLKYIYDAEHMTGQAYENLINTGIDGDDTTNPVQPKELSEVGRYYLRESDRQLEGIITYNIGETQKEATFSMQTPYDFTRNHTWIVYGYFLGSGNLRLSMVETKAWTEDTGNQQIFNW